MPDEELDPSTRAELLRLTPSGDLLDLARDMRDMGVESLLFCAPSGRIQQVVTDRQIAHLAAAAAPVVTAVDESPMESPATAPLVGPGPSNTDPVIPPQATPVRADTGASVVGS